MGPFDYIQKKGSAALKPQQAQTRKEFVSTPLDLQKASNFKPQRMKSRIVSGNTPKRLNPASLHPSESRNQRPRKRLRSAQPRLESDSDEKDSDEASEALSKRSRATASAEVDTNRQIRCSKPLSENGEEISHMVHAAEIATLNWPTKYKAAFPDDPQVTDIFLQYPSETIMER